MGHFAKDCLPVMRATFTLEGEEEVQETYKVVDEAEEDDKQENERAILELPGEV